MSQIYQAYALACLALTLALVGWTKAVIVPALNKYA